MATARDLIIQRKPRRSFNVVTLLVMLASVLALAGLAVMLLMRMNAPKTYSASGAPNGAASSMRPTDVAGPELGAHPAPQAAATSPAVIQSTPRPAVSAAPAAGRSYSGGDGSAARDAARDRAERMRREEEARQQRLADAMRSMGGVAIADTSQDVPAQSPAESSPGESGAPSGPVLGIGTQIPVSLAQRLDSTFGGQFSVQVTSDVFDERRQHVIIPARSTCYGTTTQGGVDGQARIYGAVDLCKAPDLTRIALDKFPLQDTDGATGIKARVDDHGAGRRNRTNSFSMVPSMLAGTLVPGVGGMVAGTAASAVASSDAGRAIPGPTLWVDASPDKPRAFSILVTHDTAFGGPRS
jgi:type IV secretory pathway VirB10-like protein